MTHGLPPIGNATHQAPVWETNRTTQPQIGSAPSFRELLLESLEHVNTMQKDAEEAIEQLATGQDIDMARVLTSIQKADLTFRLMLQIRNKLIQAYQELNQIRI